MNLLASSTTRSATRFSSAALELRLLELRTRATSLLRRVRSVTLVSVPYSVLSRSGSCSRKAAWTFHTNFSSAKILRPQGDQHFNITSGFDRNGDGDFNDRTYDSFAASPDAVLTRYGYLTNDAVGTLIRQNLGVMPWKLYVEANLQRSFPLGRAPKNKGSKALIVNLRSSNLINHTNGLQVGSVLGSLQFGAPVSADAGRRIEGGVRFTF
jgi:hypothetical protein